MVTKEYDFNIKIKYSTKKTMERPFISVIIATYNSGKVLAYCLESIAVQSYQNFEVIIIDGGSTDNTVDIIRQYDSYVSYWVSEADKGIYDAWNKGVIIAKGEWITFLGSDDAFCPDAFKDYAEFINRLEEVNYDFISSKLDLTDQYHKTIKTLGQSWNWKTCRLQNVVAHPGSLHKRDLFDRFGLFNTSYRISADLEFLLRAGEDMKSAFMDKVTVKMQQGGISTLTTKVYRESYQIAITTGNLNRPKAKFFMYYQMFKFGTKKVIRYLGVNI